MDLKTFYLQFIKSKKKICNNKVIDPSNTDDCHYFLIHYALKNKLLKINNGYILEFGTYKGRSINTISNYVKNRTVYGFDSFEGLPEDWVFDRDGNKTVRYTKGYFSTNGNLPKVAENVKLIKGFYDKSLPKFVMDNFNPSSKIDLLHIDCDLYSSTKCIFDNLGKYITDDTLIIFDELIMSNDCSNEFKAFYEFVTKYNYGVDWIGFSEYNACNVMCRVKKLI